MDVITTYRGTPAVAKDLTGIYQGSPAWVSDAGVADNVRFAEEAVEKGRRSGS